MGLKAYKPTTSGRRGMTAVTTEELTKKRPEKSLTSFELRTGARNNQGRTTVRFRAVHSGVPNNRFRREKVGFARSGLGIRSARRRACLLSYADGEKRYIWLRQACRWETLQAATMRKGGRENSLRSEQRSEPRSITRIKQAKADNSSQRRGFAQVRGRAVIRAVSLK